MESNSHFTITIVAKNIAKWLSICAATLVFLSIVVNTIKFTTGHGGLMGITALFDLWNEKNFPTLFSSIILLMASGILFAIYYSVKQQNKNYKNHWLALCLVFLFLSADEILELHEKLSAPVQKVSCFFAGYGAWVLPYIILTGIVVLIFLKFFIHFPSRYKKIGFISGFAYVLGAVGFEILEGYYFAASNMTVLELRNDFLFFVMVTIEETLEMGGVILFIYLLLTYIEHELKGINLKIGS